VIPIDIKTAKTIQPGDIFRSEYGDYGNYCNFVFVSCQEYGRGITEITVRNPHNNVINIYDLRPIDKVTFDVIGRKEDF
jgi:hypothetical protein